MPETVEQLLKRYIERLKIIYGTHLQCVILYGSYARGDFHAESDIDIMILLDISDIEIKNFRHQLSDMTYDFNMDFSLDIKPIAKSMEHFKKWVKNYPFYANIYREGVKIYEAA